MVKSDYALKRCVTVTLLLNYDGFEHQLATLTKLEG